MLIFFLLIVVDIDIHEMKFLFVLTLHFGNTAGWIVTTFYKYVLNLLKVCRFRVGE